MNYGKQWDTPILCGTVVMLALVQSGSFDFRSHVSFTSCDTRGSRIDDNTGTTYPHLNRKVNESFLERRGGTPPLSLPYCATRTRSNLVVTLVDFGSERLSFVSGHNLAFCRLFSSLSLFSLSPIVQMSDSPPP